MSKKFLENNKYSEKSHVSLSVKICAICTKEFEANELLLDTRLRPSMHRHTFTGFGHCPECTALLEDKYALVVIDFDKSNASDGKFIKPEDAYRLGRVLWIKKDVYPRIFNTPLPPKGMIFIDELAASKLEGMIKHGTA